MVAGGDISHTAVVSTVYLSVCLSLCCFASPPYPSVFALKLHLGFFEISASAFILLT